MTKDQKVSYVANVVREAQRYFEQAEFTDMIVSVWAGFQVAKSRAVDQVVPEASRDSIS